MHCAVESGEQIRVNWYKNNREPLPRTAVLGSDHSLAFIRAQPQDSGTYTCVVVLRDRPETTRSASGRVYVRGENVIIMFKSS